MASRPTDIAVGEGDVWVVEQDEPCQRRSIRSRTRRKTRVHRLARAACHRRRRRLGHGPENGKLLRISGARSTPIALDTWVSGVSFGAGAVWVTNEIADVVYRIDPTTNEPRRIEDVVVPARRGGGQTASCGSRPRRRHRETQRFPPRSAATSTSTEKVSLTSCSSPTSPSRAILRGRRADGGRNALRPRAARSSKRARSPSGTSRATTRRRRQAAWTSSAAGRTPRRTRAICVSSPSSARTSPRARTRQIPITNEAEDGPLAMLSPSNTYEYLTIDDGLYPTGTRSFFRIAATDRPGRRAPRSSSRRSSATTASFFLTSEWKEYGELYEESVREAAKTPRRRHRRSGRLRPRGRELRRPWRARSRRSGPRRSRSRPCSRRARGRCVRELPRRARARRSHSSCRTGSA